jgi:hypothetical protein
MMVREERAASGNAGEVDFSWRGPGRTAFAGAFAPAAGPAEKRSRRGRRPRWIESADAARALSPSARALDGGLGESVRRFFLAGGRGAYVLDDPRLDPTVASAESAAGLRALAEIEDIGTLVLPGLSPAGARPFLAAVAERRDDISFVVGDGEGDGAVGPAASSACRFLSADTVAAADPGALVGWLERTDHRPEAPASREAWARGAVPAGLSAEDALRLQARRRRAGLRRSIDWGTRWLVLDLHHPRIWRRVEREVRAFLYRLEAEGFLERPRGTGGFEVWCGPVPPSPSSAGGAGVPRVRVRVRARLAPPYDEVEGDGPHGESVEES